MGCSCCTFIGIGIVAALAYLAKRIYSWLYDIPEIPNVDENVWWGPGELKTNDTAIKPFKIQVPDKVLDDLRQRLAHTRPLVPALEGIQHQYGFNSNLLKEIVEFWQNKYDWREREGFLNQFPQFTTRIQGLKIHFLHIKPSEANGLKVVPILLLHGWPGSVREFYEIIPRLIKPNTERKFVFEVIVPDLPGYGFSEGAAHPGLNPTRIAVIFKILMERLEFDQWYVQGGDWGSEIGTNMAILYPKNVLGLHLNMAHVQTPKAIVRTILGSFWPNLVGDEKHRRKMYPLKNVFFWIVRESGYLHLQATRPDTVGISLNDSPVGLAAYILEKFIVWTNDEYKNLEDGGLALKFGYTKLLDNVMIYWVNNSITTSMRLYAETFDLANPFKPLATIPVKVPTAYARFDNDMITSTETLLKEKFKKLVQVSDIPTGGHFAAFEEPELFADDVWNAVEKFENHRIK